MLAARLPQVQSQAMHMCLITCANTVSAHLRGVRHVAIARGVHVPDMCLITCADAAFAHLCGIRHVAVAGRIPGRSLGSSLQCKAGPGSAAASSDHMCRCNTGLLTCVAYNMSP